MDSSTFLSLHNFMKTFVSLFLKNFITDKSRYRKIFKRLSRCLHVSIPSDISINFFGRRDLLQQFENKVFFAETTICRYADPGFVKFFCQVLTQFVIFSHSIS